MATTTIVVTSNADNSLNLTSSDQPAWGVYIPGPLSHTQIKRALLAIRSLIEVDLGLSTTS